MFSLLRQELPADLGGALVILSLFHSLTSSVFWLLELCGPCETFSFLPLPLSLSPQRPGPFSSSHNRPQVARTLLGWTQVLVQDLTSWLGIRGLGVIESGFEYWLLADQ